VFYSLFFKNKDQMNRGLLFLVALWAFIAVAYARPMIFFADQTDTPLGLNLGNYGVAYAFTTTRKGQTAHRVRVFGVNHIPETLTGAWLQYKNGTIIAQLAVNINPLNRYFLGDVLLTQAAWDAFLTEQVYATVASASHKNGTITGYFRCRPNSAIAFLDSFQVVGGTPNFEVGFAWGEIDNSARNTLPADVFAQDTALSVSYSFNGRVVHNVTNTTSVTFNGPANFTSTAGVLASANLTGFFGDGLFSNAPINDTFFQIDFGNTYYTVNGLVKIRGQLFPLLVPTRRQIPKSVQTVNGATIVPPGGLGTLRFANQQGTERNSNSFVALNATRNGGTNYTYEGLFFLNSGTNKRNFDLVRGLTLEMNIKISNTATWFFEWFDSTAGQFIPAGTVSNTTLWSPAFIDNFNFAVSQYANNRHQLIIRVSVNSANPTSLFLDLFGVRSWTPNAFTNQNLKASFKLFDESPGVFANGTLFN